MKLRVDYPIDLAPQWQRGLRADLPYLAKNPISSDNPAGSYLYGVGDADRPAGRFRNWPLTQFRQSADVAKPDDCWRRSAVDILLNRVRISDRADF
jgi:hypothetical protein